MLPDHIKKAIEEYIPPLGDWLNLDRAYAMAELIIKTKPKVCCEIGTYRGQSLIVQAFALRENNDGGKIYAIDPWYIEYALEGSADERDADWWKLKGDLEKAHHDCMEAIWRHHIEPWVVVIRSASQHCAELFPHNIDTLYIDGGHSEVSSCRDVENYVPRVKQGRWIWFDDCGWPTIQKALSMMDTMCDKVKDGGQYRLYQKR